MVLKVPSVHEVKKGDTLYGIARQAGVKLDDLLTLNRLKTSSRDHARATGCTCPRAPA